MSAIDYIMDERDELRRALQRAELMNEALIEAGKAVVAERDALRAKILRYERILYPQSHEQADVLEGRGRNPEDVQTTERAEES